MLTRVLRNIDVDGFEVFEFSGEEAFVRGEVEESVSAAVEGYDFLFACAFAAQGFVHCVLEVVC